MKKRLSNWSGGFLCSSILAAALASSPAHASDHEDLGDWCTESQAQLAACLLFSPLLIAAGLEEIGQGFDDACVNSGGEYRDDVGTAYPHQWGCDQGT